MFVDTGVPALLRAFFNAGGRRPNMILKVAGGAHMNLKSGRDRFQIGRRNYIVLKKLLWKNSILIDAENVGGTVARTLSLDLGPGSFWLSIGGVKQAF
jgi:chemotaxis protein CheD